MNHLQLPEDHRLKLELARKLARLMDAGFEIPGTRQRVGLDPILGLLPGVGDLIALGVALYIIFLGRQLGVSRFHLGRMLFNTVMDTLVGAIPVVGDAVDIFWRSNTQNIQILERHLEKTYGQPKPSDRLSLLRRMTRKKGQASLPPGAQTIDVAPEPPQSYKF